MTLSPQVLLSTASRERCIANLKQLPTIIVYSVKPSLESSVLLPLCVDNGEVCILYTKRSVMLRKHTGQICFPGGKPDKGECVVDTALRETEEEIGVNRQNIDVWSPMPPVQGRIRKLVINPVVGLIKNFDFQTLVANRDEVEEIFTVPISALCNKNYQAHIDFKPDLPVYIYGKFYIWGITALITSIFLPTFLPEGVYKFHFDGRRFTVDELEQMSK